MEKKETPKNNFSLNADRGALISVDPQATLFEAVQLMKKHKVGDLLVIDLNSEDQKLQGILSDRDVALTVTESKDPKNLKVADVMSAKPVTASESDDFFKMIQQMSAAGLGRLPLTDAQGKVVSIVTAKNLLDILVRSLFDVTQSSPAKSDVARTQH